MIIIRRISLLLSLFVTLTTADAQDIAIRAGHVVDVESATVADNQIILVLDGKIASIGSDLSIPRGADVVDLSDSYVLPGLIDAYTHMHLTRQE